MQNTENNKQTVSDSFWFDWRSYIKAHWRWILGVFAACFVVATLYVVCAMPQYRVTTTVMVKDSKRGGSFLSSLSMFDYSDFSLNISTDNELEVIKSLNLIQKTIDTTHIYKYVYGETLLSKVDLFDKSPILISDSLFNHKNQIFAYDISLEINGDEKYKVELTNDEDVTIDTVFTGFPMTIPTPDGPLTLICSDYDRLKDFSSYNLMVFPSGLLARFYQQELSVMVASRNSSVLNLSMKTTSKERGILFMKTLVNQYNISAMEEKNELVRRTTEFIDHRMALLSKELGVTEIDLERYKKEQGLTDLQSNAQLFLTQRTDYEQKWVETETQLNLIRAMRVYLSEEKNKEMVIPSNMGISDVGLSNQIDAYNTLLLDRNRMMTATSDNNPVVQRQTSQLKAMFDNIKLLIENVEKSLQITQSDLQKQYEKYRKLVSDIPTQERMSVKIERQRQIQQQLFLLLLQKREESAFAMSSTLNMARTVEDCVATPLPVAPKKSLVFVLALLFASFISIVSLYLKKISAKTLDNEKEVRINTFLPVYSVSAANPKSCKEAFRRLRSALFPATATAELGKLVVVTSYEKGGDALFVSSQLAASISSMEEKVVLLRDDCYAGVDFERIVSDGIGKYVSRSESGVDELQVDFGRNAQADWIASPSFARLIDDLKQKYGYVLVSASAMSETSDIFALDSKSDHILFVFHLKQTDKRALRNVEKCCEAGELSHVSVIVR